MQTLMDCFGQNVRVVTPEVRDEWDSAVMAVMAHSATTSIHLTRVLELDPQFALAQALKGMACLLMGRCEMRAPAIEALAAAKSALIHRRHDMREASFVEALDQWVAGSPRGAIAIMERVLSHAPQDTLAMKLSHSIRFLLGDAVGMRQSIEALLPAYDAAHPAKGYLLGCHAFTLEETGEYEAAEIAGRRGLELAPNDAWGLHAVAHVYDMTGRAEAGIKWLTGREQAWEHCNNFRYHVWWHKALMHLDQGHVDVALALYDAEIRKDKTDDYRDISNATSLLSRLEQDGVDVGDRWEELADFSENRADDGTLIFADLHYMLALTAGNRQDAIGTMMGRMRKTAVEDRIEMSSVAAHPGLATAEGLEAFGEGNYDAAFVNLAKARRTLSSIGGSHAQRDVFERLTIDAAIRGGYLDDAVQILSERTALRAGRADRFTQVRLDLINSASNVAPNCVA